MTRERSWAGFRGSRTGAQVSGGGRLGSGSRGVRGSRIVAAALLSFTLISRSALASPNVIATFAGGGIGDGVLATNAALSAPRGVIVAPSGNLFIADTGNNRVRKVGASGIITTVAGTGDYGFSGDGGPATSGRLRSPAAVAMDASGNLFIADSSNARVRKVDPSGIISTVAGTGIAGCSGDGGPATSAGLGTPSGMALDSSGNLFITACNRVRKIDASGIISTVAGSGAYGYSGDGGPATSASFYDPSGIAVDSSGNLFIADRVNDRVRKVDALGVIATVAGTGRGDYSGDGGPATSAQIDAPDGLAVDPSGGLLIADTVNHRIRRVDAAGIISTVAGRTWGFGGDGGPATSATLHYPRGVGMDGSGNVFIADTKNHRVRRVDAAGIINTVAGTGSWAFAGDGGPATNAGLHDPKGVAVDSSGAVFIADSANYRVRKVDAAGIISTVAGNGWWQFAGDGGPATNAAISPAGVAVDSKGNIFIADAANNRIRKVDSMGIITTVAGGGRAIGIACPWPLNLVCPKVGIGVLLGDGGPATIARLNFPTSVAADSSGNLFIADSGNLRVRKVDTFGIITTVAGNGIGENCTPPCRVITISSPVVKCHRPWFVAVC